MKKHFLVIFLLVGSLTQISYGFFKKTSKMDVNKIDQKIEQLELEALNLDQKAKAIEKTNYRAAVQLRVQAEANKKEALQLRQALMKALNRN